MKAQWLSQSIDFQEGVEQRLRSHVGMAVSSCQERVSISESNFLMYRLPHRVRMPKIHPKNAGDRVNRRLAKLPPCSIGLVHRTPGFFFGKW